jgi:hypothetical protein
VRGGEERAASVDASQAGEALALAVDVGPDAGFATYRATILKADGASLLGAALLYWLAVGPVRGFAFMLGLSTLLDLISSYFYMRPIVFLATSSQLCRKRPGLFGRPPTVAEAEPVGRTRPSKAKGANRPVDQKPKAKADRAAVATEERDDDVIDVDDTAEDADDADQATTGAN